MLLLNGVLWATAFGWFFFFPLWLIGLSIVMCVSGITKRQIAAVVVTSPFFLASLVMFGVGTWDYWRGEARVYSGHMAESVYEQDGQRRTSMDRETRLPTYPQGCLGDGNGLFVHVPKAIAIELNTAVFGYASNAWTGPLPTKAEALELMQSGESVPVDELSELGIGDDLKRLIIEQYTWGSEDSDWHVARIDEDVLVVGSRSKYWYSDVVLVIDVSTQTIVDGHRHYDFEELMLNP